MKHEEWNEITKEDVIEAVRIFDTEHPDHNKAKSTYLVFNGKDYPAKAIRKIAYKVHFKRDISVDDFSGGDESVRFFLKLDFQARNETTGLGTDKKLIKTKSEDKDSKETTIKEPTATDMETTTLSIKDNNVLKVGMLLQWMYASDSKIEETLNSAKNSDIDLLVFPEDCVPPFTMDCGSCMIEEDLDYFYKQGLKISAEIGKAIVFSSIDNDDRLYSIYVNANAKPGETKTHCYVKHVMTFHSAFDDEGYEKIYKNFFKPINLKGFKIGINICYECEFPVFSRMYGLQNVDLIVNCTGNAVITSKWGLFNKVRAIENHCSTLVTMKKYHENSIGKHSRTFGYNAFGGEIEPRVINVDKKETGWIADGIYIYDIEKRNTDFIAGDDNVDFERKDNREMEFGIPVGDVERLIEKSQKIDDNIYCYPFKGHKENIIFCLVDGMDILKPENHLSLLYNSKLDGIKNKRYIIVNRHKHISEKTMRETLSPVLKVRAMETFCAVLLESDTICKCYQTGCEKVPQALFPYRNQFMLDLRRMSGLEATWKDKEGGMMKKVWREKYEFLIYEALRKGN